MSYSKILRRYNEQGNLGLNTTKLSVLSIKLSKQQQDKLNSLGGTAWIKRQIDKAVLPGHEDPTQESSSAKSQFNLGRCQCINARGVQCLRKAEFILKKPIDGQLYEFKVCIEHNNAFRQGSLSIGNK